MGGTPESEPILPFASEEYLILEGRDIMTREENIKFTHALLPAFAIRMEATQRGGVPMSSTEVKHWLGLIDLIDSDALDGAGPILEETKLELNNQLLMLGNIDKAIKRHNGHDQLDE